MMRLSTASFVSLDLSEERVLCSKFENVGRQRKYLPSSWASGKNRWKIARRVAVGAAP